MDEKQMEYYTDIMRKNGVHTESMTWSQLEAVAKAMQNAVDNVVSNFHVPLD